MPRKNGVSESHTNKLFVHYYPLPTYQKKRSDKEFHPSIGKKEKNDQDLPNGEPPIGISTTA
eukprot:scaffold14687_cov119-Amphora_coffeaeformis.AAC.3